MFTGADLSRRSSENSLELPSRHYIKTAKPGNHGNVLETGRGASPFSLQYGIEATSTVDPNLDTELEFTPGDIGQAIVPTAGKEAWE